MVAEITFEIRRKIIRQETAAKAAGELELPAPCGGCANERTACKGAKQKE